MKGWEEAKSYRNRFRRGKKRTLKPNPITTVREVASGVVLVFLISGLDPIVVALFCFC